MSVTPTSNLFLMLFLFPKARNTGRCELQGWGHLVGFAGTIREAEEKSCQTSQSNGHLVWHFGAWQEPGPDASGEGVKSS